MTDALMDQASEAKRTALGTLLIERGYIDQEQLDEALRRSAENGERLGEVIVGWVGRARTTWPRCSQSSGISGISSGRRSRSTARRCGACRGRTRRGSRLCPFRRTRTAPSSSPSPSRRMRVSLRFASCSAIGSTSSSSQRRDRDGPSQRAARERRQQRRGRTGRGERDRRARERRQRPVQGLRGDGTMRFELRSAEPTSLDTHRPRVQRDDDEPGADNFDEVARLAERRPELTARVTPVDRVEAESRRDTDGREIERLNTELSERDETIRCPRRDDPLDAADAPRVRRLARAQPY